jgi:hypothetical protein
MEEFFKAKAKEKQKLSEGKGIQKSEDLKRPEIVATKELGKIANVSHDTIAKVKAIQEKAPDPDSTQKGKFLQSFEC